MIVETRNLTKRFGRHLAVDGVSLSVPEGAVVTLVGANGAGKTTMLRMLMNLVDADDGEATVLGADTRRLRSADYARIGYVSENQKLPLGLTVDRFFAYLRPFYSNWDRALEDQLRRRFELPADRKLGQLSRGMRMKASIAAALPYRPRLLVLDEPLGGLDLLARDDVLQGLLENADNTTILISSHELAEVEGWATHIAFMVKGRLIVQDSLENITARFRDVAASFNVEPRADARMPLHWLNPQWNGRTLRFISTSHINDEILDRELAALFGSTVHLSAHPMSLREISKTLMRAHREEAGS